MLHIKKSEFVYYIILYCDSITKQRISPLIILYIKDKFCQYYIYNQSPLEGEAKDDSPEHRGWYK